MGLRHPSMFRVSLISSLFVFLLPGLSSAATIGPVADLRIFNANISPDGYARDAALAEGMVTGPLIRGNKGDNFRINVKNQLNNSAMLQSTSIHWHGFFQSGTNWADGPAFISECPIARGHSFLYDFNVPDQAGTFWYHSHLSTQYCDGLRGPFVVYDPNDPYADDYDVDDESTVLTLADWYHVPAKLNARFPAPDAALINGKGRYRGGPLSDLAVITVEAGKRYRIRLINIACDPNYQFSIDNHTMRVIEADGVNHQALDVDQIQIFVAQRYSFILEANQPVDNYWIRANPDRGPTGFNNGTNSAILRYIGAPEEEPCTSAPVEYAAPFNEADLHPLVVTGTPLQGVDAPATPPNHADIRMNLALSFNQTHFLINGVPFVNPSIPVLLQVLGGSSDALSLLPSGSVYPVPPKSVVEISIPGGVVGGGHPFHLHGHTFDVIRSAGSSVYNYENPARRDVVNIGTKGDNVTIRFVTDNPGPWLFHCHIDWHLDAGLAILFAEDTPSWKEDIPVPPAWEDLCPIYDSLDAYEL